MVFKLMVWVMDLSIVTGSCHIYFFGSIKLKYKKTNLDGFQSMNNKIINSFVHCIKVVKSLHDMYE